MDNKKIKVIREIMALFQYYDKNKYRSLVLFIINQHKLEIPNSYTDNQMAVGPFTDIADQGITINFSNINIEILEKICEFMK